MEINVIYHIIRIENRNHVIILIGEGKNPTLKEQIWYTIVSQNNYNYR